MSLETKLMHLHQDLVLCLNLFLIYPLGSLSLLLLFPVVQIMIHCPFYCQKINLDNLDNQMDGGIILVEIEGGQKMNRGHTLHL